VLNLIYGSFQCLHHVTGVTAQLTATRGLRPAIARPPPCGLCQEWTRAVMQFRPPRLPYTPSYTLVAVRSTQMHPFFQQTWNGLHPDQARYMRHHIIWLALPLPLRPKVSTHYSYAAKTLSTNYRGFHWPPRLPHFSQTSMPLYSSVSKKCKWHEKGV